MTGERSSVVSPADGDEGLRPAAGQPSPQGLGRTLASLQLPDYRLLWVSMLPSFLGMQMSFVARGYLAYKLTNSAAAVGLVSLGMGLPMLLLALPAGVLSDRMERKWTLFVSQSGLATVGLVTALLVQTGVINIWQLVALAAAQGAVFTWNAPTRQAFTAELVGESRLMNAVALNNAGMNLTRIVGPTAAGGLIAAPLFGVTGVFYAVAALFLAAALLVAAVGGTHRPRRRGTGETPLGDLTSGVRYIRGNGPLITFLLLAFIVVILGFPYQTLLPVFAGDAVFGVGAIGLGLLYTMNGLGALGGSLLVASLREQANLRTLQLTMGIGFGLLLGGFAYSAAFGMALALVLLVGLLLSGYMTINNTMILGATRADMYGRVMSVYMMTWGLQPLAAAPLGVLADATNPRVAIAAAGVTTSLLVFLVSRWRVTPRPPSTLGPQGAPQAPLAALSLTRPPKAARAPGRGPRGDSPSAVST